MGGCKGVIGYRGIEVLPLRLRSFQPLQIRARRMAPKVPKSLLLILLLRASFFGEAVDGAPAFCFLEKTCISPSPCAITGCFRFLEADFGAGEERVEGSSSFVASQFFAETFAAGVVLDFDLVFVHGEVSADWTPMIA